MVWKLQDRTLPIRFLIRDNDKKYTEAFDTVFLSEGIKVIRTPYRAPNANAYAERWVRTVREECLDKLLIINKEHLRQVMRTYIKHYNHAHPHQGIYQQAPIPFPASQTHGPVRHRKVLEGIIHEYYREAA